MATCHSLLLLDGRIQGDPLDLEMFQGTDWVSTLSFLARLPAGDKSLALEGGNCLESYCTYMAFPALS